MKIYSNNILNGFLEKRFGKHGADIKPNNKPTRSFHIAWENLPTPTASLALVLIDYDALPVCGFPWIHWTVANIDPKPGALPENASLEMPLLQGVTSWNSRLIPDSRRLDKIEDAAYGGPAPPDKAHCYQLDVYALDTCLALNSGFYLNELLQAMEGHVLEKATLKLWYQS